MNHRHTQVNLMNQTLTQILETWPRRPSEVVDPNADDTQTLKLLQALEAYESGWLAEIFGGEIPELQPLILKILFPEQYEPYMSDIFQAQRLIWAYISPKLDQVWESLHPPILDQG